MERRRRRTSFPIEDRHGGNSRGNRRCCQPGITQLERNPFKYTRNTAELWKSSEELHLPSIDREASRTARFNRFRELCLNETYPLPTEAIFLNIRRQHQEVRQLPLMLLTTY